MDPDAAREISESMGQIGGGWWRQIIWAFDQGIPEAMGMGRKEWAGKYHGYMRMPIEDRREVVKELAEQGMTVREMADVLGVGKTTVERALDPGPNGPAEAQAETGEATDPGPNGPAEAVSCPAPNGRHADDPCYLNDVRTVLAVKYTKAMTVRDRGVLRELLLRVISRLEREGIPP